MKLIPSDKYFICTKLQPGQAISSLQQVTEPKKVRNGLFGPYSDKLFEGTMNDMAFKINRVIYYQNPCLPKITGSIYAINERTTIRIEMKMAIGGVLFTLFSLLFLFAIVILFILMPASFGNFVFLPFAAATLYIVDIAAYKIESKKATQLLIEVFEGHVQNETSANIDL
jgi:hypothetical protein